MPNQPVKDLLKRYEEYHRASQPDVSSAKIHVDEIAAKVSALYEKIRGFIDYKEEHLLRKGFIDRVFRRRFFLKELTGSIGEAFIKEIIRSGRLPNDAVPQTKIQEIDAIVDGLILIIKDIKKLHLENEDVIIDWVTKLTISAVEENLFSPVKENILSDLMFWSLKERITVSGANLSEDEINLQLFIAIQRALLRVDEDQLNYRLFKFIYPNWNTLDDAERATFAANLPNIQQKLSGHQKNKSSRYFFKLCNKYNTIFYLIGDVIDKHYSPSELSELFGNEEAMEKTLKESYKKRFDRERSRLNRLAFLSVLSIFLSKILVALGVEIPLDLYVTDEFSMNNTLVNILVPPLLMLIIVLSIKMPSEKNRELVLSIAKNILYGTDRSRGFDVVIPQNKGLLMWLIVRSIYLGIFFFTFNTLYETLRNVGFSYANIVIFAFFTSLVAATGVKVYNRAHEINVEEKPPGLFGFLIDVFALPFITVGKFGLATLSRLNILVLIFNLVIELPFQIFVQLIENFRGFIKSEKEEIN